MSGVEIHANVAATLLSTQFLRSAPLWAALGLIFGLAVVIGLLAARLPVLPASVTAALLLVATAAIGIWLLFAFGLQLPLANPLLGGSAAFAGVVAYRAAVEQRQARALVRALASVTPPAVAHEIARAPERVKLGGERRTITLLFTDLADFTSYSETVPAEVVSQMVSDYLAAMTSVVFEHGGTVDKFVGDEVMALWNAPLDDAEHARHACQAALHMQAALASLNQRWQAEGIAPQRMRIGMHTGVVSVGNMGTPQRFAYTALGDNVNLAARLEPLNKEYGTAICVSQATLDAAGPGFVLRFLDLVAVKGKKTPVAVYELLGLAGDGDYSALLRPFAQGVELYRARQFELAAQHFQQALHARGNGEDAPSAVYLARCSALLENPPGPEWDGVFVMEHK
jgi:adenylate cyclase